MNHGEEDVWLNPLDSRPHRSGHLQCCWDGMVGTLGVAAIALGIALLLYEDWSKYPTWVEQFIGFGMLIEVCVALFAAASMCCIFVTLGRDAMTHSLSVVGLTSDALLSLAYTTSCIWGGCVLHHLWFCPVTDKWGMGLRVYVVATWLTATWYTLSKIPVFWGVITFVSAQIHRKFSGTPIVRFYTEYNRGDEHYIRVMSLEECSEMVENMENPIVTAKA